MYSFSIARASMSAGGFHHPTLAELATASSNRPALDDSPDLTLAELAEAVEAGRENDQTRLESVPMLCSPLPPSPVDLCADLDLED